MRATYLGCRETIGPDRARTDAFEHDQMMDALGTAFASAGDSIEAVSWDDPDADWRAFDAALIGSCWDYQDRVDEFFAALETIGAATRLFNPPALVRWNSRKTYLRDLAERGVSTVPTLWIDEPESGWAEPAFDVLGSERIVAKRQIGANAEGQFLLTRGDRVPDCHHPIMVQPYLEAVTSEGEMSFVFIDGALSHTLVKRPAEGDYRIQSTYGGGEQAHRPAETDLAAAHRAIAAIPDGWLYARVDMVRGPDGGLLLMELEMIEPFLYPLQGEKLGVRLHAALERRLTPAA